MILSKEIIRTVFLSPAWYVNISDANSRLGHCKITILFHFYLGCFAQNSNSMRHGGTESTWGFRFNGKSKNYSTYLSNIHLGRRATCSLYRRCGLLQNNLFPFWTRKILLETSSHANESFIILTSFFPFYVYYPKRVAYRHIQTIDREIFHRFIIW